MSAARVLRGGLLPALLMVALINAPAALAGQTRVAILNFTSRGVDADQARAFSAALRESFLLDGRFAVMGELEMYDTLAGPEGATKLRNARTLLAEAKKAYRAGQLDLAREKLNASRALHRELRSELSRPDELADLLMYEGLVQFRLGKTEAAKVTFLQMFLMNPNIDINRAPGLTPQQEAAMGESREMGEESPLKGLTVAFATEVAERLGVDYLVTGILEENKKTGLTLRLEVTDRIRPGLLQTLVFAVDDLSAGVPVAGAPVYMKMVTLTERALTP